MVPKGEMIVQKNHVVSSIFILTDGMLKIAVSEQQEHRKTHKLSQKHSQFSNEDIAAFEYSSMSDDSKKGMALQVRQLYSICL